MIAPLAGFTRTKGCILLDFDRPVCSIFAGMPDHVAAQRLRNVLTVHGVTPSDHIAEAHDPLQVLRFIGEQHRHLVPEVEHELQLAELDAVESAMPTPHAFDVIRHAPELGLAIVGNNSARASCGTSSFVTLTTGPRCTLCSRSSDATHPTQAS